MSVIITKSLGCDTDDCPNWILENVDLNAKELREYAARSGGWTYRNGKDYCDTCTTKRDGANRG